MPYDRLISDRAIILLHGLNERKWDKYFTWAHFLLQKKPLKPSFYFPFRFI
jgi:hypothetical protein